MPAPACLLRRVRRPALRRQTDRDAPDQRRQNRPKAPWARKASCPASGGARDEPAHIPAAVEAAEEIHHTVAACRRARRPRQLPQDGGIERHPPRERGGDHARPPTIRNMPSRLRSICYSAACLMRCLVAVDARFHLGPEMADQTLHRPGRGIAQRADGVAFDLLGHVEQQIDLALLRLAALQALQHAPHPAAALAAGRALAAALVLVEVGDAPDGGDDVGRLVHDDDGRRAHARLELGQRIEIERQVLAGVGRQAWHRRAARDHRQQVVPAAAHAAGMPLQQFAQRNAHLLLDHARLLDVARDLEQLGAGVVGLADA